MPQSTDPILQGQVEEFQRQLQEMSAFYQQAVIAIAHEGLRQGSMPVPDPETDPAARPVWQRLAHLVRRHLLRHPVTESVDASANDGDLAPDDFTVTIIDPALVAAPAGTLMLPPHHPNEKETYQ